MRTGLMDLPQIPGGAALSSSERNSKGCSYTIDRVRLRSRGQRAQDPLVS